MTKATTRPLPTLTADQISKLEAQGCSSTDWSRVRLHPESDLSLIRDVEMEGDVEIGLLDASRYPGCGLRSLTLRDCRIADGVRLRHIPGGLHGVSIGNEATIENTARIHCEPHAPCGLGSHVSVLDETGSREVVIYPGLSAQQAVLMARGSKSDAEEIRLQAAEYAEQIPMPDHIGAKATIRDCGPLTNVIVGSDVTIEGATRLCDGCIFSNTLPGKSIAYIGAGVDAEHFIIEDGIVDAGALIRNCYIGQGARLEKGFTAHDSLFFANCSLENGEACALFAGPYTVSMHKGTLLIGCQTSFMNAGSSTNQSNHMYKLGPMHWGVLERGVKTSSNSYLMLGANIGAFSLLMGDHKTHPDSREFPFSYLFGDPSGATVVVPAVMLRSCGLLRDEKKWPSRDRRRRRGMEMRDRVIFNVLNPCTIEAMLQAIPTIRQLMLRPADDDRYIRYKGMKLSRASLERAIKLYGIAVLKYLSMTLEGSEIPERPTSEEEAARDAEIWIDLAGQPMPRRYLQAALEADGIAAREKIFDEAFERYEELQRLWIGAALPDEFRLPKEQIELGAAEFDRIVEQDRENYRAGLSAELTMLAL